MSQQPYQQPGQPGQSAQPGGYQQPGASGYPQGGYPAPGGPGGQPGYGGGYGGGQYGRTGGGNPLSSAAGLAPIIGVLGYVVAALGILGGILAFTIDGATGTYKAYLFCTAVVGGLGFGSVLLALSAVLKRQSS